MHNISFDELVMAVRRQSQGFSRGSSTHRGVTHHPNGRWEARGMMTQHIYFRDNMNFPVYRIRRLRRPYLDLKFRI